ncbi:Myb-like DNA-binding domain protein (macronuclear) [Tetrahymena thermophila SB210]|uniref:Myb-like DNA-binding domain protein n=1 Tax=Tetrahymena thermophila (strain SB210) TaxID=312017 RepID=Q23RX6_TETTS|nr:Myb-like DNA-binding domain protein [Tetrahymena thermophila SB210]EAR99263.1 Myb-like DNA-binding domain protein [Tetrahymena thermophila SB210]|eukprot:XP_001019508.1 Myb-like DNA-binding domain protein [Tetrahymena thermophila SB210]
MMRRSKRQTKGNNSKSIDETDQVEQQQPAQTKLIQKKSKKVSQQNHQEEAQNNFQISSTKRELDSVVVNLAAQLEKASNAQDAAESGRPKRVRKITEKAEQELLAKQSKAKAHQKKLIDGKSSHSESHSEPLKSLYPNHNQANNKSANTRSRKSEIHNDEHDMDIENIRICDQKTENTLQFCQQMNKHSLQQSDDEEGDISDAENSQQQDSEIDEEHQDEELEYDEEEQDEDENEDEEQENADDCEDSESEVKDQGIDEERREEDNQEDDNEEKLSLKESNQSLEENILKASTKSNQQQLGDSNNQNKLNCKESNKIVKKRSSSVDKSNKNLNFDSQNNNNNTNNNKFVDTINNKVKDESDTENQSELAKKQQPQQLACESNNTSVPPIPLLKKKQNKKNKKQDQEENTNEEKSQDEQEEKQLQENNDEDVDEEDESCSGDDDEDNKNEEGGKGDGSNSSKAKKMPWSEEEDKLVIRLVEQHGPQKWTFIAQHIPGRIGKQCRERWHNHLNPKINKEPWGDDEEWVLFLCHKLKGNKWAEITQYLPGRTDNAIKNHWNSSMKKRIPELYQRFAYIKRGESPEYDITSQYKKFEDEILKQLLAMADEGVDQYFVQTTRRRRNNNAISSTPTNSGVSVKGSKLKRGNESNEEKNDDEEQELIQVPLTKKLSKAALKAAAKQAALAEKQQQQLNEDNLNNHFTPINNNKSSNNNFKNIPNSAAASTADVKEIIQRIPHNIKEFENFRKQIIQYSDEYYQHHHLLQQTPNDKESSLNLLSADKGMNTDVNLSDTKHLEKILETPLSVENYVQQNPIFADIVRSALKYSSCQKNLTFMSHVKKSNSNVLEASVNNDHNQLSATSTLLNTVQQDKSSVPNLDQSPDDDILSSTKNGNEKLKKKRGRKPKSVKEPEISNQIVPINTNNPSKNVNTQNPNGIKKIMHGPPYMHPMYMMNPHHPHPYYANHPHHPGYYPPPPPPHMMAHMQGYPHPHHMQHPIPPPHMQHPHYRQMGHHHPPPPPPHHQGMRGNTNGQGHMMMPPPPPPHHLQQMRMRHPGMGHPHHMYMGSNMMSQHSDSSENSNFQTPQKYQKTNQGDRSIFKSVTPIIPPNSEKQIKFEEKQNKQIKLNNFNNDDDYNNFMANNSFSKENINPNIQSLALPTSKDSNPVLGVSNAGNNSTNSNSSGNSQSSCGSSNNNNNNNNNNTSSNNNNNNNSSNNNIIIQSQNHNFITPNKYETPSKLLDFDSEPRLNCNSVDKYFNMRNFSSNHKLNNLYTNHNVNNFQHSSNSAFKCYPHINMDYQDTPSAKKSSYC